GQEEGDPLGTFIQGHQDILKLDVVEGHPAHEFSMPDLKKRVREIIEHHRHRLDEITATLNDGPKTAWQVASKITWNVAPWPQLNFGTRRAAMLETLSHLQYMALRDEIRKVETEGLVTYARAE
ncbi:MAG: hypothetical protein HY531_03785, partial [Chloroflexi bacterium]|nr:hypothetical protein [Chloroflexota bacterium]